MDCGQGKAGGQRGPVLVIGIGRGFLLGLGHGALDFLGELVLPGEDFIHGGDAVFHELAHGHLDAVAAVVAVADFRRARRNRRHVRRGRRAAASGRPPFAGRRPRGRGGRPRVITEAQASKSVPSTEKPPMP